MSDTSHAKDHQACHYDRSVLRPRVLGGVLASHRRHRGWTQSQLVDQLPAPIGRKALACYEQGTRALSVKRLWDLCEALQIQPGEVLTEVDQHIGSLNELTNLLIQLADLCRQPVPELAALRQWAKPHCHHQAAALPQRDLGDEVLYQLAALPDVVSYLTSVLCGTPPRGPRVKPAPTKAPQ